MKTKINQPEARKQGTSPFFQAKSSGGFIPIQAKYAVSEPGDAFETEADRMADQVGSQASADGQHFFDPANAPLVQRQSDENIQEKPLAENITPVMLKEDEKDKEIMPKSEAGPVSPNLETENQIAGLSGGGIPLDPGIRAGMEQRFGADFGGVKIHSGSSAAALSNRLGAHAFTTGNDIFFNSGKYSPETLSGKHLLAHELTHTIQQGANPKMNSKAAIQRWPWDTLSPEEELANDKREFRSRNYGPLNYTQASVSGSGFEASYLPAANRLNITVRGKIRFADTLSGGAGGYSSSNSFMNKAGFMPIMNALPPEIQARILPYFQWTDDQKQIHLIRFRQNLETATALWQNTGMSLQVDEPGWEDVTATPNINLDITEGAAVHNTQPSGPFGIFTETNESTSDHLQVEIVKQPSADDVANITRIITEYNATTGATVTGGMIQGVRSYLGNDPGSRGSASEGSNNFMSLENDRSDDPNTSFSFTSVNFANNESQLSEEARAALDSFFSDPSILMNNAERGVEIDLHGYASAPGSADDNKTLVDNRINAVQAYIDEKMDSSSINFGVYTTSPHNDSDTSAEEDLAANPALHDPADYRRVDIMVTRQGRGGQNVFAHELGHVFGLGDEYAETANGYNRPAGALASHDQLAKDAGVTGGAVVGNDDRIMSTGNVVGAEHYSTFADALNQLTSKTWRINN
jgi:outer membrane protein OmpA-like peptidoglycan-associated protein